MSESKQKCTTKIQAVAGIERCELKLGHKSKWHMYVAEYEFGKPRVKILWKSRKSR